MLKFTLIIVEKFIKNEKIDVAINATYCIIILLVSN